MKIAAVFPGQGSQSVGMLAELAEAHPVVRRTCEEAGAELGYDLWRLIREGPVEQLNRTEQTQPALLAAGVAVWRLWQQLDAPRPVYLAGHSLGEITALVAAEVLPFAAAVRLAAERGRQMQAAAPAGAGGLAVILGLGDAEVEAICRSEANGPDTMVQPANYNAPGQVVVAGPGDALQRVQRAAETAGAKRTMLLPVSVPSHCGLMRPAAAGLAPLLEQLHFAPPAIPVLHNVDAAEHPEPQAMRDLLLRQLCEPVRWVDTIRKLAAAGVEAILELGPGKVLSGLNRRIERRLTALPVGDPASLQAALAHLGAADQ